MLAHSGPGITLGTRKVKGIREIGQLGAYSVVGTANRQVVKIDAEKFRDQRSW